MTKTIIAVLILVAVLYGGWELFFYWERIQHDQEKEQKQSVVSIEPEQLPGMTYELQPSLQAAQAQGAASLKNWLNTQGSKVADPRRAWIQLDYCVMISQADPAEARRLFAEIKRRTPENSPIWPRIKKLEKTYE
jgi:hypothetical protein